MLIGVILLAMFLSYNPMGSSLNAVGMFESESALEVFRNTIADIFFQIFGITAYLIPIFFIFCSWQIYSKKTIALLKYKIMSLFYALITIPPLHAIFYDTYNSGVLGVFLKYEIPLFTQLSYIFVALAVAAVFFAFSISWQDISRTKNALIYLFKFIYEKIVSLKNKEKGLDYAYQEQKKKINILPDLESLKFSNTLQEDDMLENKYTKENEDFKHSLFYKNIKATSHTEEHNSSPDISDDIADFSADFTANFNAFQQNNPKSAEPEHENLLEQTFFQEKASTVKETPLEKNFTAPDPIEEYTSIPQDYDFTKKLEVQAPTSIPSIPIAPAQLPATTVDRNINIQLSKHNEQISGLTEIKDKIIKKYHIPLSFLNIKPQKSSTSTFEIKQNAINLEQIIQEFGVNCKVVNIITGPVVTLYEIAIPAGVKTAKITALETDIALRMKATSVRIAVVPGKDVVGIEIPNSNRKTVFLKEILQSKAFKESTAKLPIALGYDINGNAIVADLATMPHLLIAGTTGSGKSVGVNDMILSLLYKLPPEQCKLLMIDPKMLELSVYQDIPHLLTPVVINPKQAISALKWVVKEMENRYYQMSLLAVRNITGFNQKLENTEAIEKIQNDLYEMQGLDITFQNMPYIVVIIDEMADLMMVAGKEVEMAVQRLAQMARAAGIHLIMATQRPSVNVITGTIKANFPTRISFQVSSGIDSKTIINETGAEQLLGKGDMLYMSGAGRIQRIHGAFVDDNEVSAIVDYLKDLSTPNYIDNITSVNITAYNTDDSDDEKDELYPQIIELIQVERKISTSFIQRKFQIGYNRAARIMEQLEDDEIISKANAMGKREILIK
jgi:DNA segregation ATPase FtsK/SpoIIIE-like protein